MATRRRRPIRPRDRSSHKGDRSNALLTLMETACPAQARRYRLRPMLRRQAGVRSPSDLRAARMAVRRGFIKGFFVMIGVSLAMLFLAWLLLPNLGAEYEKRLQADMTRLRMLDTPAAVQAAYEGYQGRKRLLGIDIGARMPAYDVDAAFAKLPLYRPAEASQDERAILYLLAVQAEAAGNLPGAARLYLRSRDHGDARERFVRAARAIAPEVDVANNYTVPNGPFAQSNPIYLAPAPLPADVVCLDAATQGKAAEAMMDGLVAGEGWRRYDPSRCEAITLPFQTDDPDYGPYPTMLLFADGFLYTPSAEVNAIVGGWRDVRSVAQIHYGGAYHILAQCGDGGWVSTDPGLSSFLQEDFIQISIGPRHVAAVRADGTAAAYGEREYGVCEIGHWRDVATIAAGEVTTAALLADGTVVAVGMGPKTLGGETVAFDIVQMALYKPNRSTRDTFLLLDAQRRMIGTNMRHSDADPPEGAFFRVRREAGEVSCDLYETYDAQEPLSQGIATYLY